MQLSKQDITIVAILVTGAFFVMLNQTLLSPAMPAIMAEMGVDSATVQWLTSGYALVEAVIIPLNAYLLGKIGARRLFIFGMALFAVGSAVCGIAPNFAVLMLGRVLQALATGSMMPATFAVILLIFPKERRGSAMGIVGLVLSIAPAIGPVLSGVLVDSIGWHYEFAIIFICACVLMVLSTLFLKGIVPFQLIEFDALSIVLLALGMIPLLYGLSTIAGSETVAIPIAMVVVGIAILLLFVRRQLRLPMPILKVTTLKTRAFCVSLITVAFMEGLIVASSVLFPIFAQNALGYTATVSGLIMLPGVLIGAVTGFFSGRFFDKHGARSISVFGGITLVIGFACFLICDMDTTTAYIIIAFAIPNFGLNCLFNPINTWGLNSLSNSDLPHGNAILGTIEQIGASLGTGLVVGLTALGSTLAGQNAAPAMQALSGCQASYIALFAISVLLALAILIFVRDKKQVS